MSAESDRIMDAVETVIDRVCGLSVAIVVLDPTTGEPIKSPYPIDLVDFFRSLFPELYASREEIGLDPADFENPEFPGEWWLKYTIPTE
jgi:hypothetical protein